MQLHRTNMVALLRFRWCCAQAYEIRKKSIPNTRVCGVCCVFNVPFGSPKLLKPKHHMTMCCAHGENKQRLKSYTMHASACKIYWCRWAVSVLFYRQNHSSVANFHVSNEPDPNWSVCVCVSAIELLLLYSNCIQKLQTSVSLWANFMYFNENR